MVRFPLRIHIGESRYDILFYGSISIGCIEAAIYVYRRFAKRSLALIAVILLCSVLSGWQIFDLVILRYEGSPAYYYASSGFEPFHSGWVWYNLRFQNPDILCHSLVEYTYGNYFVMIALEIHRDASWFACGG